MRLHYAEDVQYSSLVPYSGSMGIVYRLYGFVVFSMDGFVLYGHVCLTVRAGSVLCMGLSVYACLPEIVIQRHEGRGEGDTRVVNFVVIWLSLIHI